MLHQEAFQNEDEEGRKTTRDTIVSARALEDGGPYLAATLILSYTFHYAENTFSRPANIRRCLPPKEFDDEPVIGSREPTPARRTYPQEIIPEAIPKANIVFWHMGG